MIEIPKTRISMYVHVTLHDVVTYIYRIILIFQFRQISSNCPQLQHSNIRYSRYLDTDNWLLCDYCISHCCIKRETTTLCNSSKGFYLFLFSIGAMGNQYDRLRHRGMHIHTYIEHVHRTTSSNCNTVCQPFQPSATNNSLFSKRLLLSRNPYTK